MTRAACPDQACQNLDRTGYDLCTMPGQAMRPSVVPLLTRIRWGLLPAAVEPNVKDFVAGIPSSEVAFTCMYGCVPQDVYRGYDLQNHGIHPTACTRAGFENLETHAEDSGRHSFVTGFPDPLENKVALVRVTAVEDASVRGWYSVRLDMLGKADAHAS